MRTYFTRNPKVASKWAKGISSQIQNWMGALLFVSFLLGVGTPKATSQTWTSIATDVTGDSVLGLLDGTELFYYYNYQADSVSFRITVDTFLAANSAKFGAHIQMNIPNISPLESWGNWQGGGITQNTAFDYNRLLTTWVSGTPPTTYNGTIGFADIAGVTASNYNNLSANNIGVFADTINNEIILSFHRNDFVTNAELNDTVRTIGISASVGDSLDWSDDISTGSAAITMVPAPGLDLPLDGALGELITGVNLEWDTIEGATNYIYEYALNPTFTVGLMSGTSTTSDAVLTGLNYYTTYYWRVLAVSGTDTSTYSPFYFFNTELEVPILSLPPDSSISQPVNGLVIEWDSAMGATEYIYEYSEDSTFTVGVNTGTSPDTFATLNGLNGFTTYYWHVASSDGLDTSAFSPFWRFRTNPAAPMLIDPADLSEAISISGETLRWNHVIGADDYQFQYSTQMAFGITIEDAVTIDSMVVMSANKNHNQLHYWRVRAMNTTDTSEWSTVFNFRTKLDTVDLEAPVNGTILPITSTTLVWENLNSATGYRVQYTPDITFSTGVIATTVTGLSTPISGLTNSTVYYWRVRGLNTPNDGEWSNIWSFQSGISIPDLIVPVDLAIDQPVLGTVLSWTAVPGGVDYDYEYCEDSTFQVNVLGGNTVAVTQMIPQLNHGRTYFWRVRSNDGTSVSPWSVVWRFNTVILDQPVHVTPISGSAMLDMKTVTLTWNPVFAATGYVVNYGRDQTFLNEVNVEVVNGVSTVTITDLFGDTPYFWRVRATDGQTFSPWTLPWNFGTAIDPPFLISPDSGSINVGVNDLATGTFAVGLNWEAVKGAASYQLNVSEENDFSVLLYDNLVFGSNFNLSGLESFTTYFWRVQTFGGRTLISDWSEEWNFSTAEDITNVLSIRADEKNFNVFPNPGVGLYNIEFDGELSENAYLQVFNHLGQMVATQKMNSTQRTLLDIQNWDSGMYTITIHDGPMVHSTPVIKH